MINSVSKLVTITLCGLFISIFNIGYSGELNASIEINLTKLKQTNTDIFKTLRSSLQIFLNQTSWTEVYFEEKEKIKCKFIFIVDDYKDDNFSGTLQIQSYRPVYNSVYETTMLNINDKKVNFSYVDGENLFYNPYAFTSNLVAIFSYYAYVIIGVDLDSFMIKGGSEYLRKAKSIVDISYSSDYRGWKQEARGIYNRYNFIESLLSGGYQQYRLVNYNYNYNGLDKMTQSIYLSKSMIFSTIRMIDNIMSKNSKTILTAMFFDAKHEEIGQIFSDGLPILTEGLKDMLNKLAPQYASSWKKIK